MASDRNLDGRKILVVEDDYYLATDAARALQAAGATVLGPCPTEEAARDELAQRRPDAVVLDVNLGAMASFRLARLLRDAQTPFVFVTGYDRETIPPEFADVGHLIKPAPLRSIVGAISKLLTSEALAEAR
jgi:DNA-binding response OmpR family regulator